jgi:MraZ protein
MAFRGNYEHSLDAKNRLTIPVKFRAELAGGIVIAQGLEPCAGIWTPDAFESFTRGFLEELNPLSQEARRLSRYFNGGSFDTELDGAGRVMVPPPIIDHAGLGKEVVIVGNDDHLELWDAAKWSAYETDLNATVADTVEKIVSVG